LAESRSAEAVSLFFLIAFAGAKKNLHSARQFVQPKHAAFPAKTAEGFTQG
jgi:hypothetical protein